MAKFRKKPVVIEAIQFKRRMDETPDWYLNSVTNNAIITYNQGKFNNPTEDCFCLIETLEGRMRCNENDWIIKGVNGEVYSCKPDIFKKTYEVCDD